MSRRSAAIHKPPLLGYHVINTRGGGAPAWTPASISGLKLWIDFSDADTLFTDAGSTNVSSDGDLIYQANDKSGNGYHFTQATSGSRPTYKTDIQNGLSTGLFSSDFLSRLDALGFTGNPEISIFIVCKATAIDANYRMLHIGDADGTAGGLISVASDASFRFHNGYEKFTFDMSTAFSISCWYRPASGTYIDSELFINDSELSRNSGSGDTNTVNLVDESTYIGTAVFGASYYGFIGYIAEVIICAGDIRSESLLWTYLNNKWSIYEPAKSQSLEGMLSFETEEEKLWWQGANVDVLAQAQPQIAQTWWDKANKIAEEAIAKAKKWIVDTWHKIGKAIEDYFDYHEED